MKVLKQSKEEMMVDGGDERSGGREDSLRLIGLYLKLKPRSWEISLRIKGNSSQPRDLNLTSQMSPTTAEC